MPLADEKFLPTGTYAIINAEYNCSIALSGDGEGLSTSSEDYGWTISLLGNKKWTIQGSSHKFVDLPPDAEEGEDVLLAKNPPKARQWAVKRRTAQHYIIYSPTQPQLIWSLPDGDEGTTPQLSVDHSSDSSLWKFKRLETPVPDGATALSHPSSFIYYRIYNKDDAIPTKRPAYLDNAYIGRISSIWIPPPLNAGSLRIFLSALENIDPSGTSLFDAPFRNSSLADGTPLDQKNGQVFGALAKAPLILFSGALPRDGMKPGTELFIVPPDAQSWMRPRLLYYGIYSEDGPSLSKAPTDINVPWVSTMDLDAVPLPLGAADLGKRIGTKEKLSGPPQIFLDKDAMTPFLDNNIVIMKGNSVGSTVEDHVMLKFAVPLSLTITEAEYYLCVCSTGRSLSVNGYSVSSRVPNLKEIFTFKPQEDGGFAVYSKSRGTWMGRSLHKALEFRDTEQSLHFIRSDINEDWFSICSDSTGGQAIYDSYNSNISEYGEHNTIAWRDFAASDQRQLWYLQLVDQGGSG